MLWWWFDLLLSPREILGEDLTYLNKNYGHIVISLTRCSFSSEIVMMPNHEREKRLEFYGKNGRMPPSSWQKKVWFQVETQQWVVDKPFMEFNVSFSSLFSGFLVDKNGNIIRSKKLIANK